MAGPGPTTLAEMESRKGKKRKSEGAVDGEKRPKIEDDLLDIPARMGYEDNAGYL